MKLKEPGRDELERQNSSGRWSMYGYILTPELQALKEGRIDSCGLSTKDLIFRVRCTRIRAGYEDGNRRLGQESISHGVSCLAMNLCT